MTSVRPARWSVTSGPTHSAPSSSKPWPVTYSVASRVRCSRGLSTTGRTSTATPERRSRKRSAPPATPDGHTREVAEIVPSRRSRQPSLRLHGPITSRLADGEREAVDPRPSLAVRGDLLSDARRERLHLSRVESWTQAQHDAQDAGPGRVALADAVDHVCLIGSCSRKRLCHKGIGMRGQPLTLLRQGPHHAGTQHALVTRAKVEQDHVTALGDRCLSGP